MFRNVFKKRKRVLLPEGRFVVELTDDTVSLTDDKNTQKTLCRHDLSGVVIETNDSDPWGADVWWLLYGQEGRLSLAIPQGATGEEALIKHLTKLEGFNHEAMIAAMGCVDNATFLVWPGVPQLG